MDKPKGSQYLDGSGAGEAETVEEAQRRLEAGTGRKAELRTKRVGKETQMWLEVPHLDDWIVAYRLVLQEGGVVVGEMRIYPAETTRRKAGEWSGHERRVPDGGLTARALRRVNPGEHLRKVPAINATVRKRYGDEHVAAVQRTLGTPTWMREAVPRKPGRRGRPVVWYALLAHKYVELSEHEDESISRSPVVALHRWLEAQGEFFALQSVYGLIVEARRRGVLTKAQQGQSGGALTPHAVELITTYEKENSSD